MKQIKMRKVCHSLIMTFLLFLFVLVAGGNKVNAHTLSNPKVSNGNTYDPTTWNYVYFGSYPQDEVTDSKTIASVEAQLKKIGQTEGDVRVGNYRYRKVTKVRKQYIPENDSEYKIVNETHYYKWTRIKWRVLQVSGNTALLMSDKALFSYDMKETKGAVEWATSDARKYLNSAFFNTAFSTTEKGAILTTKLENGEYTPLYGKPLTFVSKKTDTEDKIFIPDTQDLLNDKYGYGVGFGTGLKTHMNRTIAISDYLKTDEEAYKSSADQTARFWLRSNSASDKFFCCWNGRYQYNKESKCQLCIVPALRLNLSKESAYVKTTFNNVDSGAGIDGYDRYSIKYVLNGGKNSSKNPSVYYGGAGLDRLENPTRTGYTFLGWYADSSFKTRIKSIPKTAARNYTLYAKWEKYYDPNKVRTVNFIYGGLKYRLYIKGKANLRDVRVMGMATKKTSVNIPSSVKYDGKTYKVMTIADGAFKNNKNIKTLVINANVSTIGKEAFSGCKYLYRITVKSLKLTRSSVKDRAFKDINMWVQVKVPNDKLTGYTTIFRLKGLDSLTQTIIGY